MVDPDGPYGEYWNSDLRPFDSIADFPCLVMLGEPGIGKTSTMRAEREGIDARVRAGGERTFWLDLRSCGSEYQLARKLFENERFVSWLAGDYRLHVFLDSLDECRLRVDNVAAVLSDELKDLPSQRLSLRIGSRTAEWPKTLEDGLRETWDEGAVGVYELAPLRRLDVAAAATANGLDADGFLEGVHEVEAVPLAIKPVTLEFLLESYKKGGRLPSRQTELYLNGCRRLCEERNEDRVDARRTGDLSADQRLAVAARIAAVTVFANKYAVWNGLERDNLDEDDVTVRELAGGTETVGGREFAVGEDAIREALGTGLFSARGSERLGWAHQTYAEFLAAHYLVLRGVETGQAMSLVVHPDDQQGRLVPQLHEAAAWMASTSPEVFRAITDADPEVLLRSDVASTDVGDRANLVGTLLQLYDEEKLLDVGLIPPDQYRKLEHPGLAEQLRPFIADAGKGIDVRQVAFDIARACELRALQREAVEVALDASQELLVRKDAARFVASAGDSPTRGRLKPLALGEAGSDPDDDLRGSGLRAVWPEHMEPEELFETLKPPRTNYAGSYHLFLNHELPESLRPFDLPAALAWVEEQERRHEMSYRLADLMDRVMSQAWGSLEIPEVRRAFAKAALARLRLRDELVWERSSNANVAETPSFREVVTNDAKKRRAVVEEMLDVMEDDPSILVYSKTPLVLNEDVAWLIARLEDSVSDERSSVLAALINRAFNPWDDEQHELVYRAYQEHPALADEVGRFFDAVDLSGDEAERLRKRHGESEARRKEPLARPQPDPPLSELIVRALDDFEAGDVDAFWRLNYYMMFDEYGVSMDGELAWDLTELPGWKAADEATTIRIVEAAERYLLEGDPRTDEWLGKEWPHRPALAGYRALRLLQERAPGFVSGLSTDAWDAWIPAILDFPITTGTGEEGPHLELVAMAYERSPQKVIDAAMPLVDKDNYGQQDFLSVTRDLEKCWDDRLASALLEKSKDEGLRSPILGSLLDDLLAYGLVEAERFAESVVAENDGTEWARDRAVAAARALIFHADGAGWSVVWPTMQVDDKLGRQLAESVANDARHSGLPQARISEERVADLYVWMFRQYPPSEYYLPRGGGSIGFKENMGMWRDDLLRHLQGRGTAEGCRQIERIGADLPELQDRLKRILYQARAETRRQTWVAPEPRHVLGLTERPARRLLQNGDQLLELLIESLERFQGKLRGSTPAVFALWNEVDGSFTPKDEERISDQVKLHLESDLTERGVVVNREVVIRRGGGGRRGERTDIHVDAVVSSPNQGQYDTVSVIIEAKGCWNRKLGTAMEEQLVNRYLQENQCRHGLYLVGWFNCEQWDAADPRKGRAPKYGIDAARGKLEEQAIFG